MNPLLTSRHVLSLAVVALVAACGGGEAPRSAAQEFAAALSPDIARSDRLRVLAVGAGGGSTAGAATVAITNAQMFQGAEVLLPTLFPSSPAPASINNLAYDNKIFQVRAYGNGNYLAVASDGRVYGLGPYTNGQLKDFGLMQAFADIVCTAVNCGGGGSGGTGALNGCTEGASIALSAGRRYQATYTSSVLVAPTSTGEYQIEGEVEGSASFEGQSAIKQRNKVKGMQSGTPVDIDAVAYVQAAENDLTRTLGSESSIAIEGGQIATKLVYNPASLNNEYTLAVGGSLTKTESFTSTSTTSFPGIPFPLPPIISTDTSTTTHTYEARETITVLGRSWDTCRYKTVTEGSPGSSINWLIVGKGFAARVEGRNAAGTVVDRSELKSAFVNGAPL